MPNPQYILLPPRGISVGDVLPAAPQVKAFFISLEAVRTARSQAKTLTTKHIKTKLRVLDSIKRTGAKLVEMSPEQVSLLQSEQPGLRIVPVVYYSPARFQVPAPAAGPKTNRVGLEIKITVVSRADQTPIPGARVLAFTDFAAKTGVEEYTDASGQVSLPLGANSKKVERLYVYSAFGFWNALKENFILKSEMTIDLLPIDLGHMDVLRHFYGAAPDNGGAGVTVGVIDTGVGPHRDLDVRGGQNTVNGQDPNDYGDTGEGHGTHVAGIIAARGTAPQGIRGLAPAVKLKSYRVFGKIGEKASSFAITKAIDQAVADGCDIINMSLGGKDKDPATSSAITEARAKGSVIFAASGNDEWGPVSFPGSDPLVQAVSAFGRKGTFPADTTEVGDIAPPPSGADPENFIARFSNIGTEIVLTGPGVGIISTFPGNHYAVEDGTSMACPAVAGATARLLATHPAILGAPKDQSRSDAIVKLALDAAKTLGFPSTMEGRGMVIIP